PPQQPGPEPISATGQPTQHRPGGPAELSSYLGDGFALQIMKHERESIFFREMTQLFVQHRSLVCPQHLSMGIPCGNFKIGTFGGRLPESVGLDLQGNTKRDLVQPTADGSLSTNGARLSTQDQEGRLKGILGIVPT